MSGPSTPPGGPVRWDAAAYHAQSSAQAGWGREVHERLALRGDESLLDLGCGDGRLTAELAGRLPEGSACGLDADPDMVAFARRTYARENLSFEEADARTFSLGRTVEVITSTACLHWVPDHEAVLRRCRAHLAPGGRLHFQMGGRGNCAEMLEAGAAVAVEPTWAAWLSPFRVPWNFPAPEAYQAWLPRCGFRLRRAELCPKDMVHASPDGLAGWVRTTWMPVLAPVPVDRREPFIAAVVARHLRTRPPDAEGRTHVGMVRLEVEAEAV